MSAPMIRTLSRREAELMGRLESERRLSVSVSEVIETLGWPDSVAHNTVSRLAKKGWLRRTARGRYEVLLAETGGWDVPNPWAALASWQQRYYVGFVSAAYEHGLTPDRPGSVQTCVPAGAKRPRAWSDIPIELVYLTRFDLDGTSRQVLHRFDVQMASPERLLVDGGNTIGRMGGILGLARVLDRAVDQVDWAQVVRLAKAAPRGHASLRRLAALADLLGREIPTPLATAAAARPGDSPLFLASRQTHGARGERLSRWLVIANVEPGVIREEVAR